MCVVASRETLSRPGALHQYLVAMSVINDAVMAPTGTRALGAAGSSSESWEPKRRPLLALVPVEEPSTASIADIAIRDAICQSARGGREKK